MIEQTVKVRRPILDVFDLLMDVDRIWQWAPFFLASEIVERDENGWPSIYRARIGYTWQSSYETEIAITDYQRGRSVSYRAVDPPQVATVSLESAVDGTLVTARQSAWRIPVIDVFGTAIEAFSSEVIHQTLTNLRDLLESRPASGRPVAFLSYRRSGAAYVAGRIVERLTREFGQMSVFHDISSIGVGGSADREIDHAIQACDATVVLIDRDWIDAFDERARHSEEDYVRMEILAALRGKKLILPIILEDVDAAQVQARLPAELKLLEKAQWQALRHDPDFEGDISRVVEAIWQRILKGGPVQQNSPARRPRTRAELSDGGDSTGDLVKVFANLASQWARFNVQDS